MPVNPIYARSLVGQWVECRSAYGIHRGLLHEVRRDGIVLAIPRGRIATVSSKQEELKVEHLDHPAEMQIEPVQFFNPFFNPFFFFIPFAFLFGLRRRDII